MLKKSATANGVQRRSPAAAPQLNKHQQRTEQTRRKLLKAAEKIFARTGFEAARLEDIAEEAGYTRGAFYAQFTGKEDLFFALLEQKLSESSDHFRSMAETCRTDEEWWKCLREYYSGFALNRNWSMLTLEFKLFVARRPKLRAKLVARYRRIRQSFRVEGFKWPDALKSGSALRNDSRKTKLVLEAMLHGLVLQNAYDPEMLSQDEVAAVLGEVFDLLARGKQTD